MEKRSSCFGAIVHSLRHSLNTMLATSGVPMAVAQRIMRHRDIRLTAEAYMDEGLLPLAEAMQVLPELEGRKPVALRATGADDRARTVPDQGASGHNEAHSVVRVSDSTPSHRQRPASLGTTGHVLPGGRGNHRKVGDLGFEPRLSESESLVLPLHQSPICVTTTRTRRAKPRHDPRTGNFIARP